MGSVLFAEHLHYANVVNLTVQLASDVQPGTTLQLTEDQSACVLEHNGECILLGLPARVTSDTDLLTCDPESGHRSKTLRLTSVIHDIGTARIVDEDETPWSASSLDASVAITCAGSQDHACHATILQPNSVHDWRDLPSQGWAEMMDMWHCHKPEEPADPISSANKGYDHASSLRIEPGMAFVEPLQILLSPQDCSNVNVSSLSLLSCIPWTRRRSALRASSRI